MPCESGYFLMVDVSKARDIIPSRFLESHDYELGEDAQKIKKNVHMNSEGKIPLDLAFCRWFALEKKVVMMPNSLFYHSDSPYATDKFVRFAICKNMAATQEAVKRMKHDSSKL